MSEQREDSTAAQRCVKCGHNRVNQHGVCVMIREGVDTDYYKGNPCCMCKCSFSEAAAGEEVPERIWVHQVAKNHKVIHSERKSNTDIEYARVRINSETPAFSEAAIRNQAENIINKVFPTPHALKNDPFPLGSARYEMRELITKALLAAHNSAHTDPPSVDEAASDDAFVKPAQLKHDLHCDCGICAYCNGQEDAYGNCRAASEGVPPERDPSAAFATWFKREDFGDEQRAFFAGVAFMAGIAAADPRLASPSVDEAADAVKELREACQCLYLAVPKEIADDVKAKAEAVIASRSLDASGYVRGLEDAAKACDDLRANRPTTERGLLIATECAEAIRALISQHQETKK